MPLYAAAPGHCGHGDVINKYDIIGSILKAEQAGNIEAEDALVPVAAPVEKDKAKKAALVLVAEPVEEITTREYKLPLHELYVVRSKLKEAYGLVGISQLPWPEDEYSSYWEQEEKAREPNQQAATLQNATAGQLTESVAESENKSLPAEKTRAVRTSKATKARINQKAARKAAMKAFIKQIEQKLAAANYNWNLNDIPVTKADFCKVARRVYPELKNYRDRTITNDLGEFGVKFRPGTNNRENNILERFFSAPKLA